MQIETVEGKKLQLIKYEGLRFELTAQGLLAQTLAKFQKKAPGCSPQYIAFVDSKGTLVVQITEGDEATVTDAVPKGTLCECKIPAGLWHRG